MTAGGMPILKLEHVLDVLINGWHRVSLPILCNVADMHGQDRRTGNGRAVSVLPDRDSKTTTDDVGVLEQVRAENRGSFSRRWHQYLAR